MKPNDIEALSFSIIDREAGAHPFNEKEWQVVRRMIHTSADFEYLTRVRFHPDAIDAGIRAIRKGKPIYTDTNMARVGIRKGELSRFGGTVECLIDSEGVRRTAVENGITRALAAVDAAAEKINGGIYVVGNAPTALLRIVERIEEKSVAAGLIVGVPVGFVNAAESKDALMKLDVPFIATKGRKGGSNIAASIVNALLIMAAQE